MALAKPPRRFGSCWDADRLTLTRLGITPDPAGPPHSTEQGIALAVDPALVPDQDACDWQWVAFRYALTTSVSRHLYAGT